MAKTDVTKDSWERCPKPYDSVILANGDYPTHPIPLSILHNASHLICCDGAATQLLLYNITPDAIVGDGDSLLPPFKKQFSHLVHIIDEQEYNDLTKATRFAIQQGFKTIAYLGCTGKREDHTLGNISLLSFYQREFHIQPVMYTDHGTFIPCQGIQTLPSFPRQQVSIFNLTATALTSEGLRWQSYPYREWWQGTLNESLADTFTIHADGDYIVFQTYKGK